MRLVFATRNADKIAELRHALEGLPFEITSTRDYPQIGDIEESGATFEANARIKARAVHEATGETALADDSGLEVDALDGAPGVLSARYAGPSAGYRDNLEKLLAELRGVPPERRTARFRTVIAVCFSTNDVLRVEGHCEGVILTEPRGSGGFGYDPVFFYPPAGRTFAEMDIVEKGRVSHRGLAMRAVRKLLADRVTPGSAQS